MPKSKKVTQKTEPAEDTRKLNARAYATRLAKQVAQDMEKSRRTPAPSKKRNRKV